MVSSFEVTWDYLCPFARNAHEHLAFGLERGADWEARFRFFSLAQAHQGEGSPAVWETPREHPGVLAGLAGLVVREHYPERFLDAHLALFGARHDRGLDLRDQDVIVGALDSVGLPGKKVLDEAEAPWAVDAARADHEEAVQRWEVFGVPTFIVGDRAVFVRLMSRPAGDAKLAEATIERLLELAGSFGELNEYKFTKIPR
jgi:hypothetical protein